MPTACLLFKYRLFVRRMLTTSSFIGNSGSCTVLSQEGLSDHHDTTTSKSPPKFLTNCSDCLWKYHHHSLNNISYFQFYYILGTWFSEKFKHLYCWPKQPSQIFITFINQCNNRLDSHPAMLWADFAPICWFISIVCSW